VGCEHFGGGWAAGKREAGPAIFRNLENPENLLSFSLYQVPFVSFWQLLPSGLPAPLLPHALISTSVYSHWQTQEVGKIEEPGVTTWRENQIFHLPQDLE